MANKDYSSPTLRMYGSQQRLWRTRTGVSREQLSDEAGYSLEMVKAVEQARRLPPPKMVEAAEDLCGAGGLLRDAAEKIVRSKYPDWFEGYVQYEADAASLGLYEHLVLPGLFQTEGYARAVFLNSYPRLDDREVERRLTARIERQALLSRTPLPMISAVIEQVTLERWVGGREVMKGQLSRLLDIAELRHVDIQFMPTRREAHAGLNGSMYLIESHEQQRVVYSEMQKGGVLITDQKDVSDLNQRYAMLRSQALTPEDSVALLRRTLGEL